jgi:hypothetical protein
VRNRPGLDYRGGAYDLRKIQAIVANSIENKILELVNYAKQILTERCHLDQEAVREGMSQAMVMCRVAKACSSFPPRKSMSKVKWFLGRPSRGPRSYLTCTIGIRGSC